MLVDEQLAPSSLLLGRATSCPEGAPFLAGGSMAGENDFLSGGMLDAGRLVTGVGNLQPAHGVGMLGGGNFAQ